MDAAGIAVGSDRVDPGNTSFCVLVDICCIVIAIHSIWVDSSPKEQDLSMLQETILGKFAKVNLLYLRYMFSLVIISNTSFFQ
jgi:hypothetical protein